MLNKIRLMILFIISAFCLMSCSVEVETPLGEIEYSTPGYEDDDDEELEEKELETEEPKEPEDEQESPKEEPKDSVPGPENPVVGEVSIRELCNNETVDELFDLEYDELPEKMDHVILGYAPYSETVTDKSVIAKTIDSLKKVRVMGVPSGIEYSDASGDAYYFELEDGSKIGFSFEFNYFVWKNDYYEVMDGAFQAPVYVEAYAGDRSFMTKFLNCYNIEWDGEGLYIFPLDEDYSGTNESGYDIPFLWIRRFDDIPIDAGQFVEESDYTMFTESFGEEYIEAGPLEEYEVGGRKLSGMLFTLADPNDPDVETRNIMSLAYKEGDVLIDFTAYYWDDVRNTIRGITEVAIENLEILEPEEEDDYDDEERFFSEVKPNNRLLDFCNNEKLSRWFDASLRNLPDRLVYTADSWTEIKDPKLIREILEALKTVVIGDVSDAHVGGSGRQIFDFHTDYNGEYVSFMFFQDTFDWGYESYDVLDWGDLDDIVIPERKSSSDE